MGGPRAGRRSRGIVTSFRVNTVIWDDDAFVGLSDLARTLLFAIITGPQATVLPGLQRGSVAMLADTLRRSVADVDAAFYDLVRQGIVELDAKRRVMRAMNAPKHNPADSPNHIRAWWNRWREIPDCALKFRHVATLREYAQFHQKGHESAWKATFGTIPSERFAEFDTTEVPSKPFGSPSEALHENSTSTAEALPKHSENPSEAALASALALASASASHAHAREGKPSEIPEDPFAERPLPTHWLNADAICDAIAKGAGESFETRCGVQVMTQFVGIVNEHKVTIAELESLGHSIRASPPSWIRSGRVTIPLMLGKAGDGGNFTNMLSDTRMRRNKAPPRPTIDAVRAEMDTPKQKRNAPEVPR